MAKRLTDTDKWKHKWFRSMPIKAKLVFLYLCDQCDSSGIWPADFEQLSFQLGGEVSDADLEKWFGDKVIKFDHDKYFVTAFFEFQYAEAKDTFRAKQAAASKLQRLGLMDSEFNIIRQSPDSPPSVQDTPSEVKCIEVKSEGGTGETKPADPSPIKPPKRSDWEALAKLWPRTDGRTEGVARLVERYKTRVEFDLFANGLQGALRKFAHEKTESSFVPYFSTFVGTEKAERWRDTIDWKAPAKAQAAVSAAAHLDTEAEAWANQAITSLRQWGRSGINHFDPPEGLREHFEECWGSWASTDFQTATRDIRATIAAYRRNHQQGAVGA